MPLLDVCPRNWEFVVIGLKAADRAYDGISEGPPLLVENPHVLKQKGNGSWAVPLSANELYVL